MRRLIVVAGLSLAILTGSVAGSVGEVAAAKDDTYRCVAVGPIFGIASGDLTEEEAEAFKEQYKAQGFAVKCKKA